MLNQLPDSALDALDWDWAHYAPHAEKLAAHEVTSNALHDWLANWSRLHNLLEEVFHRLYVDRTAHTDDPEIEARFTRFLDTIFPEWEKLKHTLTEKLLASGLEPEGFAIPLRNARVEAALFREENLQLIAEHQKLGIHYEKIISEQTVDWEGREVTITELAALASGEDRPTREHAWRLGSQRILQDREAINANWIELLNLRRRIAHNAGLNGYRDFAWQQKFRFDYTPDDCKAFHAAIEEVVVPATARTYERRRALMGVATLRPWDLSANPLRATDVVVEPIPGRAPLKPFRDVDELEAVGAQVFTQVDPQLGAYFQRMRDDRLLDLPNRKGKAPGAYCIDFAVQKVPFIFHNAAGSHEDVQTLLHEAGHAFHVFERINLPYHQMQDSPMEFNEVASMAMELLAAPYLTREQGGFYTQAEAARARIDHLTGLLVFWPYMAVVDAFQHWVHENIDTALDPARCDEKWAELWNRYIIGVDYSGLEQDMMTGWHRKLHIHRVPFYYVEYGLAQLGAVQVWANAIEDQAHAVASYRRALSLGGTSALPDLYAAAGARFAFDAATLRRGVDLIERTIEELAAIA